MARSPRCIRGGGATIKRVIVDWGRAPQPCFDNGALVHPVAYQQILKGYPAVDYAARDIIYAPRNPRANRVYGFSPVEQIVMTANIALKRQMFTLSHFTEGNIPESLIGVPENWTPDQIKNFQDYWDAYFTGDLAARRRAKFVPGGVAKTFIQTKEPELKNPFDEWLARIVCFFGVASGLRQSNEPLDRRDAKGDGGRGRAPDRTPHARRRKAQITRRSRSLGGITWRCSSTSNPGRRALDARSRAPVRKL